MSEDTIDAPLHDPRWKEGETVTLRAGNKTWAMAQRANAAMTTTAMAATGLSAQETKDLLEEQGEDALEDLIRPHVDPVVQQISIMRSMILSWTLPWPLTFDGLEQLPEAYGQPIWDAIEARKPAPVPRTPVGDFRGTGTGDSEGPLSLARHGADAAEGGRGMGHQGDGLEPSGPRRGRR